MPEPASESRIITVSTRRLVGSLWLVKLAEQGHGGTKYMPWWSKGDPWRVVVDRLARVLEWRAAQRDEGRTHG
jgi:hypothetical protein